MMQLPIDVNLQYQKFLVICDLVLISLSQMVESSFKSHESKCTSAKLNCHSNFIK